jgi:hypothetical protein
MTNNTIDDQLMDLIREDTTPKRDALILGLADV